MIDLTSLARVNIRSLIPYSCAREEYKDKNGIFLDANENSLGSVLKNSLNRYPDPLQQELKEKIAQLKSVHKENIFLGNGSDEAIDLLIRAFCEPISEKIIILPPTYGMYGVCGAVNNVPVIKVPLTPDFKIDLERLKSKLNDDIKLIFICSPNNPTGNCFDQKVIEWILQHFNGLIIIDEAYIDFSTENSWLRHLDRFKNLVVLQTLSKAWGLANIRLGMAFAQSEIIEILTKIKYPYSISGVTQKLTMKALNNPDRKEKMVQTILMERKRLRKQLQEMEFVRTIYPSESNFLLVRFQDSHKIFNHLSNNKIFVRNCTNFIHCDSCLRITVGTPSENEQLITALRRIEL